MDKPSSRFERDTMGEMEIPENALWGVSTQRAVLNFPISGERVDPGIIHAYGLIKWATAKANVELGAIPADLGTLIEKVASGVHVGSHDEHFVVDVFQTPFGSWNLEFRECGAFSGTLFPNSRTPDSRSPESK